MNHFANTEAKRRLTQMALVVDALDALGCMIVDVAMGEKHARIEILWCSTITLHGALVRTRVVQGWTLREYQTHMGGCIVHWMTHEPPAREDFTPYAGERLRDTLVNIHRAGMELDQ